jgi:hypothetical protein
MDHQAVLKESIQFELPDLAGAARLARLLRPERAIYVHERGDVALVTAFLRSTAGDLATLLRSVEAWVSRESLCAIRFELDNRDYVLEAGGADWTCAPCAEAA